MEFSNAGDCPSRFDISSLWRWEQLMKPTRSARFVNFAMALAITSSRFLASTSSSTFLQFLYATTTISWLTWYVLTVLAVSTSGCGIIRRAHCAARKCLWTRRRKSLTQNTTSPSALLSTRSVFVASYARLPSTQAFVLSFQVRNKQRASFCM